MWKKLKGVKSWEVVVRGVVEWGEKWGDGEKLGEGFEGGIGVSGGGWW